MWLWFVIGCGLAGWLLSPAGTHAQSTTLSQTEYQDTLTRLHTRLHTANSSNFATTKAELDTLASQLDAIEQIELNDGQTVSINHRDLASNLRTATTDDIADLLLQVEALQQANQTQSAAPDDQTLQEILTRPEYQWAEEERTNYLAELWLRLLRWLLSLIPESAIGAPIFRYLLPSLAAIILLAILVYFGRNLRQSFADDSQTNDPHDLHHEPLSADDALTHAQNLSTTGDYRTAVRYLYLSALLLLDERNLLRYDRSRTNREYLRSVATRPELATILKDVVDIFDEVWYGYRIINQDDYTHYEAQVTKLKQLR